MFRTVAVLAFFLLSPSLAAQLEFRGGARAGAAISSDANGTAVGLEALLARGPFALSASGDHYHGSITTVSLDAQFRFRMRGQRIAWIAAGRSIVDAFSDIRSEQVWAPSAGFQWPLGNRRMFVTLRHHNASKTIDPRFRPRDLNTTLFMVGIRSTNLLEW